MWFLILLLSLLAPTHHPHVVCPESGSVVVVELQGDADVKGSICDVTKHLVLTCPPPLTGVVFWATETSKGPLTLLLTAHYSPFPTDL